MAIDSKSGDQRFESFLMIMDEQLDWLDDEAQKRDISLDMTLADLPKLEKLFDLMSQGMSKDDVSGLVVAFARHLGEVLVQSHGGQWHLALDDPMNVNFDTPVIKGHSKIEGLEFAPIGVMRAYSLRKKEAPCAEPSRPRSIRGLWICPISWKENDASSLRSSITDPMDESFAYSYTDEGFGPAVHTRSVPAEKLTRFAGKLPEQLLSYWRLYGWSGYGNGLFWTVDPDAFEPALEAWIGDMPFMKEDSYHVIARSAFGELFLWGARSGKSIKIMSHWGQNDCLDRPLFDRAVKSLGPLAADEMYGFEPALALGGKAELESLRRVKAVEHLVLLAQLGKRQVMRDIGQDARAQKPT